MQLGLRELRLAPEVFWALTPAELMLIAGRDAQNMPMTRSGLAALAEAYPDTKRGGSADG